MRARLAQIGKILSIIALAAALISIGYSIRDDGPASAFPPRTLLNRLPARDAPTRPKPLPSSQGLSQEELAALLTPSAEPADLPAPVGDLAHEIDSFTDVAACVKRHTRDPLIGDGLEALGYDSFLTDLCRGVQAMKSRDVAPCQSSMSSAMKRNCMRQVAMIQGDAALCPIDEPRRRVLSHDRVCLAAARRDVRPCTALPQHERITCEALVAHDVARCGTEPHCLRFVHRYMSIVPAASGVAPYASRASVEIKTVDDSADAGVANETIELAADAAAGAVLIVRRDGLTLHFGALEAVLRPPQAQGGLLLELPTQPSLNTELTLSDRQALALLKLPSGLDLELANKPRVKVTIERLDREPNGVIKLKADVLMGPPGAARLARWTLDTWLRDVVTINESVGAP
ncbi:MAG: hypothetical protein U0165_11555 [Polyangiaceae bacterium]